MGLSPEISALLKLYRGRKLISIKDIIEFCTYYKIGKDFAEKNILKEEGETTKL